MPEAVRPSSASGDVEALTSELLEAFRTALGRPDFGPDERFLGSGGDSLTVMEIILDVEARHGVSISAAEFMALDSAEALARHIVEQQVLEGSDPARGGGRQRRSSLTVVQAGSAPVPLVCAYGQAGKAAYAIPFAEFLPDDQPLAALNVSVEQALAEGVLTLREGAASDADAILAQYPGTRSAVLGFSLGAHVALAVGHELGARGTPPALLVVLDDSADLEKRHFGAFERQVEPTTMIDLHEHGLMRSPAEPIAAHVVYFRSDRDEAFHRSDPTRGWGEIATGGVTIIEIAAGHDEFVQAPSLRQIGPRLAALLAQTHAPSPPPSAAQLLRYRARLAGRKGDLAMEIALYETAIAEDAEQPVWLYANLAEALFQRGDPAAALRALDEARHRDPWPLALDLRFLGQFRRNGLDDQVAGVAERCGAIRSDHPSVSAQLATAYLRLGRDEDVARELEAGLAMAPTDIRLSHLTVRHLRQQQAWDELLTVSERLVEQFPGKPQFRNGLIVACLNTGDPARALEFREEIGAASPPDPDALVLLARALLRLERAAEALELVERAIPQLPDRPGVHILRGNCLRAVGRAEEAAEAQLHAERLQTANLVS